MAKKKYKILSLFSGCGGLDLGFSGGFNFLGKDYKQLNEKFRVSYANRFEEGEFRKRIQFMYAGKLEKVQLKFFGTNPEAILDRLPTARVLEQYDKECTIEAEVYGKGIIMWLLSQGCKVEVLKPESMREEMKNILMEMLKLYQ